MVPRLATLLSDPHPKVASATKQAFQQVWLTIGWFWCRNRYQNILWYPLAWISPMNLSVLTFKLTCLARR